MANIENDRFVEIYFSGLQVFCVLFQLLDSLKEKCEEMINVWRSRDEVSGKGDAIDK